MLTNYHHRLFILTIVFIYILLLPVINCTNDQLKETPIENNLRPAIRKNHLYELLNKENLNKNSEEDKQIKHLIEDLFKIYPHRRASSFHAMRGKRSIKTIYNLD